MSDEGEDTFPEVGYDLAVPFILCASNGGPFDDDAFVMGYETGAIASELDVSSALYKYLQISGAPRPRYVHTEIVPQLDLIAMRHGFVMKHERSEDVEWTWIEFSRDTDIEETA